MSTARVVSAWTIVVAALHDQDHDKACADYHARRHAKQIDHRRNQDEAAANAEKDGQNAARKPSASGATGEI